jgi:two-component system chemotaxis sensor kinase CheA
MVVLTDVTIERRLAEKVDDEHERLAMIVAAVTDSRDFFDLVDSFRRFARTGLDALLGAKTSNAMIIQEIYRQIHTFKGSGRSPAPPMRRVAYCV